MHALVVNVAYIKS